MPVSSRKQRLQDSLQKNQRSAYADLERLRAEFEEYDNGSIPVTHYCIHDEWFATTGDPAEAVNMKGIQLHGQKYRVQKRINGTLRKWSFNTLSEALQKRDAIFSKVGAE